MARGGRTGGLPRPQFGGVRGPQRPHQQWYAVVGPLLLRVRTSVFPFEQVCHLSSTTTRTPQHRDDITVQIAASEPRCWLAFPVSF